jgi:uncharacterized RDD family membrane protein YckC
MAWQFWKRSPRTRETARQRRTRVILTAEGLRLGLTLASRGSRVAALLIDLTLVFLTIIATALLLSTLTHGAVIDRRHLATPAARGLIETLDVIGIIALFVVPNGWFLWFELGARGATPGKRLLGIRIAARPARDGTAARLTAEAVIARNLLRNLELFMPVLFIGGALNAGADTTLAGWTALVWFGIFALFPFFNRDGLRGGDVIAGTWVVEVPRTKLGAAMSVGQAAQGISTITGAQYRFSEAELAVYGEYELQVLERVLRDGTQAQSRALQEVAQAICAKIGWTSGTGDERAFLEAYYTQLRARLETGMRLGRRKADKHDPQQG